VYGETALQLAGYRFAEVWVVDNQEIDIPPIDYCAAIHVRADGYELVPVIADEQQHKEFLYAARVGQFVAGSRDLVGAPIVAPTTSTFRLVRESQ